MSNALHACFSGSPTCSGAVMCQACLREWLMAVMPAAIAGARVTSREVAEGFYDGVMFGIQRMHDAMMNNPMVANRVHYTDVSVLLERQAQGNAFPPPMPSMPSGAQGWPQGWPGPQQAPVAPSQAPQVPPAYAYPVAPQPQPAPPPPPQRSAAPAPTSPQAPKAAPPASPPYPAKSPTAATSSAPRPSPPAARSNTDAERLRSIAKPMDAEEIAAAAAPAAPPASQQGVVLGSVMLPKSDVVIRNGDPGQAPGTVLNGNNERAVYGRGRDSDR